MPRKKRSRVPSRARPIILDNSVGELDMEAEQRKEKLRLLLQDFDHEVQKRVEVMEEEIKAIQQSIRQMYKTDLMRYPADTRNMLWIDYIKQNNGEKTSSVRNSMANVISSADNFLQLAAKKRGRKPVESSNADDEVFVVPLTTTRSTRRGRKKTVLGTSQADNLPPPSSTSRVQCKKNMDMAMTPANQNILQGFMSTLTVTPKFDPRTPLPPGTVKRKPRFGEIAISLTGSPLQVSPAAIPKVGIEGWMASLDTDNIDEETKAELQQFHERVGKLLNM
ncbi:borealin [Panulirus ornatus]|uniref:borealin n=1 Tax=Panulirus ornatus TaxID=150431 RepID=UPI003A897B92